jgi:hypothetical protein
MAPSILFRGFRGLYTVLVDGSIAVCRDMESDSSLKGVLMATILEAVHTGHGYRDTVQNDIVLGVD